MRRIVGIFSSIFILFSNISLAYITREINITAEKVIPFSFSSTSSKIEEEISIKDLENVKVKDVYVDNGEVDFKIDDDEIDLSFSEGDEVFGTKTVIKTGSYSLDEVEVFNDTFIIENNKDILDIKEIKGDFYDAKINSNKDIEVKLKENAKGVKSYDKSTLVTSTFEVNIDDTNKNREIKSDEVILPHNIVGEIKAISGDTSNVSSFEVKDNKVKITFDGGIPKANEVTEKLGYTYCWVDRDENGKFKNYIPNSIYSTDKNKITGKGEYLDEGDFNEIGMRVSNSNWLDYCGVEENGRRYVFVFDEDLGVPRDIEADLINKDSITIKDQYFNTEKYTINFSKTGVSYVPEGKLYSMGELIEGTEGWGSVFPNQSYESKKTFFNKITGKEETYVKHFKFFYGPSEKKAFGGYYTYPYNCVFSYNHYKPVELYSGEVIFDYEEKKAVNGYLYTGWVKISYEKTIKANDYPPTAPFNIKYNPVNGYLSWGNGNDDYTPKEKLKYEIQIYNDDWKNYKILENGKTSFNCVKELDYDAIRIRTIDEMDQVSAWGYGNDNNIEILGEVNPYIVSPGENITIDATTKSFLKIKNVVAENAQMQMYQELQPISSASPDFFEMSYNIYANFFDESDDYLFVDKARSVTGNKDGFRSNMFDIDKEFTSSSVKVRLDDDIKFSENGTLIFCNQNFLNPPIGIFKYQKRNCFLEWSSTIYLYNKEKKRSEVFIMAENNMEMERVKNNNIFIPKTRIYVNKFNYDENGNSTYEYIDVDKKLIDKPFFITWNTDVSGITEFNIRFSDTVVYKYTANREDIENNVDNFYLVSVSKELQGYALSPYGYLKSSTFNRRKWPAIGTYPLNRNLQEFLWLGYKVNKNEYIKPEYVNGYNNNPQVRNNYRWFISDEVIPDVSYRRYIDIISKNDIAMTRDKSTVFGDDVLQYISTFQGKNILIPDDTIPGKYEITLTAKDIEENEAVTKLTIIVKEKEEENKQEEKEEEKKEPELENNEEEYIINSAKIGRFFYKDGKGYLEELKVTDKNKNTEGFICAGETLGIITRGKNLNFIDIEFLGDKSITTFDSLTKKFLIDNPSKNGKDVPYIENIYSKNPIRVYPQYVDNFNNSETIYFYTIPYGTKQTIHSWSTLRDGILEEIDTSKLFNRIKPSYKIVISPNGDKEKAAEVYFDVFERWDTVLNRDVSNYIINSDTRWEMRVDK